MFLIQQDGREVGFREIPVVLGVLFGAEQEVAVFQVVPASGFLGNGAAVFQHLDLTGRLIFDRPDGAGEGVDILHLDTGAEGLTRFVDRNVDVAADGAFLHLAVGDAEVDDRLPDGVEVSFGFGRASEVGFRNDLNQRDAAAVEVDQRPGKALVVDQLASVFLNVDAGDADPLLFPIHQDIQVAVFAQRDIKLADLVRLRQVGVEIVLAVLFADRVDGAAEGIAHLDRVVDDLFV